MSRSQKICFSHPFLVVEFFDKKYHKIHLKSPNDYWTRVLNDTFDKLESKFTNNDTVSDKPVVYYYLKRNEFKDFLELVETIDKRVQDKLLGNASNEDLNESSSSESETSDDSSSDDELIQKTLTRRLTSQSKHTENDNDHVSDSEMEDVISVCRRFRSVYKLLTNLAGRIETLENIITSKK